MVDLLYALAGAGGGLLVGTALGYLLARLGVKPSVLPGPIEEVLTGHEHDWHIMGKIGGVVKYECIRPLRNGERCVATAWDHEVKRHG